MSKIRSVIIDDEASNRRIIAKLVQSNLSYEVVGETDNVGSAYDLILKVKPQLVFLDIKMPDGTGFDLLRKFDQISFEVVFVTGYDSYALKAFEFSALDYVLKPINPDIFGKMLAKVESRIVRSTGNSEELNNVIKTYDAKTATISKVSVHNGNSVVILDVEEVMYVKSEEKCVWFKMKGGERYASSKELSDFSFILDRYIQMIRINKGCFININFISAYSKGTNCFLTMKDNAVIEVPRRKKTEILELLGLKGNGID